MKLKIEPAVTDVSLPKPAPLPVRFRDKVFTSRTLVLPSGNLLYVVAGVALVSDDSEGFKLLNAHAEFEPLE